MPVGTENSETMLVLIPWSSSKAERFFSSDMEESKLLRMIDGQDVDECYANLVKIQDEYLICKCFLVYDNHDRTLRPIRLSLQRASGQGAGNSPEKEEFEVVDVVNREDYP